MQRLIDDHTAALNAVYRERNHLAALHASVLTPAPDVGDGWHRLFPVRRGLAGHLARPARRPAAVRPRQACPRRRRPRPLGRAHHRPEVPACPYPHSSAVHARRDQHQRRDLCQQRPVVLLQASNSTATVGGTTQQRDGPWRLCRRREALLSELGINSWGSPRQVRRQHILGSARIAEFPPPRFVVRFACASHAQPATLNNIVLRALTETFSEYVLACHREGCSDVLVGSRHARF